MRKHCIILIVATLVGSLAPLHPLNATVVINEFMASNSATLADDDADFEDWIELHNYGDEEADLGGWGLSDNGSNPFKWRFPEGVRIGPGGYLIVWASGKDRHTLPGEATPGILREVWMGIPGASVSDLTAHPDFPNHPTSRNLVTDYFEAPTNIADDYGQRMHAVLVAPATGQYRFWIASDDNGTLYLSTNENPANASLIASVPGWTSPREWDKYTSQRSALIPLVAGQRYYISALMKEFWGGDNLAVRWQLPNGTIEEPIPAHHFETVSTGGLHTNFRIASDGEELLLTRPDGEVVDYVDPVHVPRDISFGRQPDGGSSWHHFDQPTPGAANTSPPVLFPPTVSLSEPRGFKTQPILVALTATDPEAVIRYTLDGSTPGTGSPVYSAPIAISKTTTLRAAVVGPDLIGLPPTTATYLFLNDILQQGSEPPPGWPADRAVNNHAMEYGLRQAIVTGDNQRLRQGMTAIPSISLVTDLDNLFHPETGIYSNSNRSHGWERPTSVELIDPIRGESGEFQIDAGLRLRGAFSRSVNNPKHSFRLLFRSAYGENRLRFPLFEDEGASEFHKVDLRTSQNYSWAFGNDNRNTFVREVFSRDSQRDMGMPYTRSRYYHLYINGQYWGLYQTQERGEADFAATYMGGDSDDWDCIKTSQPGYSTQASDGNFNAFYELHDITINQGFSGAQAGNYWRVRGLNSDGTRNPDYPIYLDEDNLINYMLVAHYTGDPDSPVSIWGGFPNNMYGLFSRADPTGFKWLRHDAEHSLGAHGSYGVNTDTTQAGSSFTTRSHFNPSTLHLRLMGHPEYRMRFADLTQAHLYGNGALSPENAQARVQARMQEIDLAIIGESARWGRGRTRDATWLPACNAVLGYLGQRRDILAGIYRSRGWFPTIDAPRFTRVNDTLRISAETAFYYMTDGSDPRLPGGGIHPNAVRIDGGGQLPSPVTLVPRGSTWRYFDLGHEPPPAGGRTWIDPDYPDAHWNAGPATLGFAGASVANPVATVTRRWVTGSSGPQVTTTYFRHAFTLDELPELTGFIMEILRDDGAIIYLNGVELLRENMPPGPVTYDTFASSVVGSPDQNTYFERTSDAGHLLRPGLNVLAARVHQVNPASSDLYFDFSLTTTVHGNVSIGLPLRQAIALKARAHDGTQWSALAETSTLSDLPEGRIIHAWDFEDPEDYLSPSVTLAGGALALLPGDTTTITRNDPAQGFDTAHLRINDPLGSTLLINAPTSGFEQIQIAYETRRSGQGAGLQTVEYTTDGATWNLLQVLEIENAPPQSWQLSLANIFETDDNPDFAVRITFVQGEGGTAGNNRFDDIRVTGVLLPGTPLPPEILAPIPAQELVEDEPGVTIDLGTVFANPNDGLLTFSAQAEHAAPVELALDGNTLTVTPAIRGGTTVTVQANNGIHAPVSTSFDVLVYPKAYVLADATFAFGQWSPDEPGGSYPEHMVFLQGEESDSALDTPLGHAYRIPPEDAAEPDDAEFPYRAASRTRINGLGTEGISFINTGRGRDLGSALLALDTRNVPAAPVAWVGGTVLPNTRVYAIRLQYRIGHSGPFLDLLDAEGDAVEYIRHPDAGHQQSLGQGTLPPEALEQPHVQLLWRYYRVSGDSGPRAQLRLDDILVGSGLPEPATQLIFAEPPPAAWQSGIALPPFVIHAVSADGFIDPFFSGPVTLSTIGGANLEGTLTVQAVQGRASFENVILSGVGNHHLRATSGTLTAADSSLIELVDTPLFIPGADGDWTLDVNWTQPPYPDGNDARARIHEPTAGDRDVTLRAPVTISELTLNNRETSHRNRIQDADTENTLTFASATGNARLIVDGSGTGWVEFNIDAGTFLEDTLRITVNHREGNTDDAHGALRLRKAWSGPGGLVKDGLGILSLTGANKDYLGATVIEQGVLSVSEPSAPANTASVSVNPGGQLRLVSSGESRIYQFGGDLFLNSEGRGGNVPEGDGHGILGALRYEPGSTGNSTELLNNIILTGLSGIHVANEENILVLRGTLSGSAAMQKSGGGALVLAGNSPSYSAPISVANGELHVDGVVGSTITLNSNTRLRGSGRVGMIGGSGEVAPGPGAATLTAETVGNSLDLVAVIDPDGAGSLLRLTGAEPFGAGLTVATQLHLFLTRSPDPEEVFQGGLFTDTPGDFLPAIAAAQVLLYIPDASGSFEHDGLLFAPYNGSTPVTLATVSAVRDFGTESVPGRILELRFGEPEPAASSLRLVDLNFDTPGEVTCTFDIMAPAGQAWLVETSIDLREWSVVEQVLGAGMDQPVRVTVTADPDDPARFWRLKAATD